MNDIRAHDWVGRSLAGCRILLELDRGRSSVVFVGQDLQSHAPVAIKIIPPGKYADAAEAAAPAIMSLVHPHITRLITFGRHDNHLYLIYEFVAFHQPLHTSLSFDASTLFSKHLAEYVQEQPALLALADVIDLLQQLLDALIYAHGLRAPDADIAFGSIHPHHILVQLDAAGRAQLRIAGLGLPRHVGRRAAADAYLSPEELQGQPPSQASDIYALGAIAYLLIIGIAPPAPLVDPSHIRADAAPAWDAFIRRALAFAPAERFADFEDMRRALLALRVTLRSPSFFSRMKTALFVNVIVGLLVVVALVAGVMYYRSTHPPTPAPTRSDVEIVSDTEPAPDVPLPPVQADTDNVIIVDDEITTTAPPVRTAASDTPLDLSGSVALAGATVTSAPPTPPTPTPAPTNIGPIRPTSPIPPAPQPAAPTPAPTPTAPPVLRSYTVKPGDTFFSIARAHNIPLQHLLTFNNLTTASVLKVGQTLLLVPSAATAPAPEQSAAPATPTPAAPPAPAFIEHRVQPGETYFSISRKYHCTVEQLQALNNNQPLRFDTVIKVPAPPASSQPAPAPAANPTP